MEEIKKLLEENGDYSDIWSDGSDWRDDSVHNFKKLPEDISIFKALNSYSNSNSLTSKSGKQRLPTRRPDPNVYNRNALLARENRRKKKVYLETVEKELYLTRKANRVLIKALRRQIKIGHRLEKEKEYFKGLIGKGSNFLGIDQDSKTSTIQQVQITKPLSESSSLESLNLFNSEDGYDLAICSGNVLGDETGSKYVEGAFNGTVNNPQSSLFNFHAFPDLFTDLESNSLWENNGNNVDNLINQELHIVRNKNVLDDVNNDHCYVLKPNGFNMYEVNDSTNECFNLNEKCLHGSHEEFCEIFCPSRFLNTELRSPPLQLLSDS